MPQPIDQITVYDAILTGRQSDQKFPCLYGITHMRKIQFWKTQFVIGFPYKHCNFRPPCLPIKMASKTVVRSTITRRLYLGSVFKAVDEFRSPSYLFQLTILTVYFDSPVSQPGTTWASPCRMIIWKMNEGSKACTHTHERFS